MRGIMAGGLVWMTVAAVGGGGVVAADSTPSGAVSATNAAATGTVLTVTNTAVAAEAPVPAPSTNGLPPGITLPVTGGVGAGTNASALTCERPAHDFGDIFSERPLNHTFHLVNAGATALNILGVHASCGCATFALSTNVLAPGQAVDLTATVSLKGRKGRQRRTIYVETDDARSPRYRLEVVANLVPEIDMQPEGIFFGALSETNEATQEVVVVGRSNVVFQVTQASSSSPLFTAEIATNEPGHEYRVRVTAKGPRPSGTSRALIDVRTDFAGRPSLTLPVTVFVAGDIMTIPPSVVAVGTTTGRVQRLNVYSPAGRDFKITAITPPDPRMEVRSESTGPGRYRVTVNFGPADVADGQRIRLTTDLPTAREVTIPIRVLGRPGAKPAPLP